MPDLSPLNVNSTVIDLMELSRDVIIELPKITVNNDSEIALILFIFVLFLVHFLGSSYLFLNFLKYYNQKAKFPHSTFILDNELFLVIKEDNHGKPVDLYMVNDIDCQTKPGVYLYSFFEEVRHVPYRGALQ